MDETEKLAQIRREYDRDIAEQPFARTLDDVPAFYDRITPEWLSAVIQQDFPGAEVSGYTLGPVDSGTTNRRRLFLHYDDAADRQRYPASLFCKAAQDLNNRITMSAGSAHAEVRFYNELRDELDIEAPHAYFAKVHVPSYRAIIVLKDLQDAALFCDYTTTLNRAQAESQVRLLAAMHARFYNDAANPKLRAVDTFANRFRRVSEYHGLEEACGRGYLASEAVMPRSVMRRYDKSWPLTLASVEILSRERSTLTHGDVHLGNWYMLPGNVMGLSDFQNMTLGHWVRDLAYTIVTSLNVEDRRSSEGDLIRLYMETLFGLVGGSESFDSTWRHYRQQMLSVLAWWTVTLTPAPTMAQNMQTPETSLCFIGRIGQAMEDLETFDAF